MKTAYWHLELIVDQLRQGQNVLLAPECLRWVEEARDIAKAALVVDESELEEAKRELEDLRIEIEGLESDVDRLEKEVESLEEQLENAEDVEPSVNHFERFGA